MSLLRLSSLGRALDLHGVGLEVKLASCSSDCGLQYLVGDIMFNFLGKLGSVSVQMIEFLDGDVFEAGVPFTTGIL